MKFGDQTIDIIEGGCISCGSSRANVIVRGLVDVENRVPGDYRISRCLDCGFRFLSKRPTPQSLPACYPPTYHARASRKSALKRWLYGLRYQLRLRRLEKWFPKSSFALLEVGCGDASFLRYIEQNARETIRLYGVDFNVEASSVPLSSKVTLSQGELSDVPSKDFFQLILLYEVLEHVAFPTVALKAMAERMDSDGLLVGTVPCWDSPWRKVFPRHWAGLHIPRHQSFFCRTSLKQVLAESGFELKVIRPIFDPGDLSLSLCNWMTARLNLKTLPRRSWLFVPVTLLVAPLVWFHTVVLKTAGDMEFVARKLPPKAFA